MKIFKYLFLSTLISLFCSCNRHRNEDQPKEKNIEIHKEWESHFEDCRVEGAVVIYDYTHKKWMISDTTEAKKERLPASTFKIINTLILLEEGLIPDENYKFPWVGYADTVKYGYRPEIYRDMSIREAFQESAVWMYLNLAEKLGRESYRRYFKEVGYGNKDLSQTDTDFWNFGTFGVSQIQMVEFLKNLYEDTLPFSKHNMEIVKDLMITEQTNTYTIRAKTGWTREGGINLGWWAGYVETPKGVYFFTTRLLQDRKYKTENFGTCRKEITKAILRELNIIY